MAAKQPALNYVSMEGMVHCTRGLGSGRGFRNTNGGSAAVGDHPFSRAAGAVRSVNDLAFLRAWNAARAGPRPGVRRWARE